MPGARPCGKPLARLAMLIVAAALFWAAWPAAAQPRPNRITAELLAEGPVAPGGTVTLAFRMRPETGWHGYWLNPGDAGQGMQVSWSLPAGAKVGNLQYPVPDTLVFAGLMNHVYEHEYAVLASLTAPPDAQPGQVLEITAKAEWLACSDSLCVPESGEVAARVTVGSPGGSDPRFAEWRRALPAPLGSKATFALETNRLRLAIPLPQTVNIESPHLFLATEQVVDYAAVQTFSRKGDLLVIEVPRVKFAPATPERIDAVLRFNALGDGLALTAEPGVVPVLPVMETGAPRSGPVALGWLLLGALAGGLLLNVMPCVFPILSLKALSLARAGESEDQARAEGLAYTAGVVLACLALGALLLALRAAGQQVGWAFQLQEPLVVAGLLLLALAITANLAGLYEFAVPGFAREGSRQGAFATGLLAAFVATPCTGPFMAAAMGAALLLPLVPALALFATLGLGIALPFLAIAFLPGLRKRLPRPGAWMGKFRMAMAVPMGLTALALIWLTWRLAGSGFAFAVALLGVVLVSLLVLVGRRQRAGRSAGALLALIPAIVLFGAVGLPGMVRTPQTDAGKSILPSRPFSEAALAAARAQGKPVFVWFTADWCLTCKVNEKVAIEREGTRAAFARSGVVVLKGDWTRRDPAITSYLTKQGAAGVPLYVWYPANGAPAQQLPQVLGPDSLVDLVR